MGMHFWMWPTTLLTSFSTFFGCCSYTGQAHILWLILYKHQTHKWEGSTEDAWHGQNVPPVIVLEKHCDQDWTQTTSQVHAAGQHRPPCSKLGGLEPLTTKRKEMRWEVNICKLLTILAKSKHVHFTFNCQIRNITYYTLCWLWCKNQNLW